MARHFVFLILPLILANVFHMIVVKKNGFSALNIPVNKRVFGANKTWRGFVFVPVASAVLTWFISFIIPEYSPQYSAFLGFVFGLVYMLSELPNSYLKRRIGIAAGERPKESSWLFVLIDKSDSALGVCLTYLLLTKAPFMQVLYLFIVSILLHFIISFVLVKCKLKSSF